MNLESKSVVFSFILKSRDYSLESGVELDVTNVTSILSANFIDNAPFKIIVHGFTKNYKCWVPQEVKDSKLTLITLILSWLQGLH